MLAQEWCYPLIACQTVTASSIASVLVVCLSFSLSRPFPPLFPHRFIPPQFPPVFPSYPSARDPDSRHSSPETWRKKRYCATPPSFLVQSCPPPSHPPLVLVSSSPGQKRTSGRDVGPECITRRVCNAVALSASFRI